MSFLEDLEQRTKKIKQGGKEKYHQANAEKGKLFVRKRLELLLDDDIEVEDAFFANCMAGDLPSDGVVTGIGKINDQDVCVMANDSTVKAGSWGKRTVEKILRIQETAMNLEIPMIYLVDSAGARITDQIEMFPGRRGAGRIFHNQIKLSGRVPQVCLLFGPSAAGGAYIPAFCDVVVMVEGNASMYLGSPRMAEKVIGEKVSLEEMGGAKMHCTVSGVGDVLVKTEEEAISYGRKYLGYFPPNFRLSPPKAEAAGVKEPDKLISDIVPEHQNAAFNMVDLIDQVIDEDSFCEVKKEFAKELITGFGRINGEVLGIIANQPRVKGGVLFTDSADKAAKFIQLCDAFNIPLLFLTDVPGFMIGTKVEREGIIRQAFCSRRRNLNGGLFLI
jgi:acetyl-CoA carboxylase carboxyltransferase component